MPIGPNNINKIRHQVIQHAQFEIDSILLDAKKSSLMLQGDSDDYYYEFLLPGIYSPDEKSELARLYEGAGWAKVVIVNSAEVSQRPGIVRIRMYIKSDSRFLKL